MAVATLMWPGVLFGMLKFGSVQKALEFGNAASAIKNTIPGDLPVSDYDEVSQVIQEHHSAGPGSERNVNPAIFTLK